MQKTNGSDLQNIVIKFVCFTKLCVVAIGFMRCRTMSPPEMEFGVRPWSVDSLDGGFVTGPFHTVGRSKVKKQIKQKCHFLFADSLLNYYTGQSP